MNKPRKLEVEFKRDVPAVEIERIITVLMDTGVVDSISECSPVKDELSHG